MGEKVALFIYIICTILVGLTILITGEFTGELEKFELTVRSKEVFYIIFITVVGFFLAYLFYIMTKSKKKYLTKSKWIIDVKKFDLFFLVAVFSQIIFVLVTEVGIVGRGATSGISFIFSMLGLSVLFYLYYFICRSSSKIFLINVVLFSILQLILGWTAFILDIVLFEIYFYFKRKDKYTLGDSLKVLSFPILGILIGGKIYQYTYAFKFKQRYGFTFELSYFEGLINLVNRLTHINISIGAYQNLASIKQLYIDTKLLFPELLGTLRPIIPRFLMPLKEFRTLNNLVLQSFNPEIVYFTSSNFGLINYAFTLMYIGFFDFFLWLIVTVILFSLSRRLINSLEQFDGQLDFIYFLFILKLFTIGSPEIVFSYGYLQLIYVIPLLFLLKIIRFEKRTCNEE